jgi:uncharacterized Fe-S radical SAM superfamily protein PflX
VIRIHRGKEPAELARVRDKRLFIALAKFNQDGPDNAALHASLKGYDVAKAELFLRQHRKCAYCERRCGLEGQPTDLDLGQSPLRVRDLQLASEQGQLVSLRAR